MQWRLPPEVAGDPLLPECNALRGNHGQSGLVTASRCAKCGRAINHTAGAWTPTAKGELCEECLRGPESGWVDAPAESIRHYSGGVIAIASVAMAVARQPHPCCNLMRGGHADEKLASARRRYRAGAIIGISASPDER